MFNRILVFLAKHPRVIPEPVLRALFAVAADVVWLLGIGGVRQLERNLTHVLASADGEIPSHRRLRKVSHQGMRAYFAYFAEAMTVGGQSTERLLARTRPIGPGYPIARRMIRDEGMSMPIAIGHLGNWDYEGLLAGDRLAPVTTVAERLGDTDLLQTFIDIRKRMNITVLLTGQPDLTEKLEHILTTRHVTLPLLADRDLGPNGEFVKAFGGIIRVARGPAMLALDTGLPLLVVTMYRERLHGKRRRAAGTSHGYVVYISEPLDIDDLRKLPREEAIHAISQAWVDEWSKTIKAHPADWHMLQPVFLEDLDFSRLRNVPERIVRQLSDVQRGELNQ